MIALLGLSAAKIVMRAIYLPLKALKTRNKTVFISRQADTPNLDFELLAAELKALDPDMELCFLCRRLRSGFMNKLRYIGFLFKAMYHLATARYCVADTYNIPISLLNHKKTLTVVQIWHGLGTLKKFGYQILDQPSGHPSGLARVMRMHENYTFLIAIGREMAQLYTQTFHISLDKIRCLGMPRIDYILSDDPGPARRVFERYPRLMGKRNVLYVPTFRKNAQSDLQKLCKAFDFEHYNLVVKYHPLDKARRARREGLLRKVIAVYDPAINIYDLYKACDVIVTDYSAASLEACLLDKPLYFYLYDFAQYAKDPGLNLNPFEIMPQCTSADFQEIMGWISDDRYDMEWVRGFRRRFFDIDLSLNCSRALAEYMLKGLTEDASEVPTLTSLSGSGLQNQLTRKGTDQGA